MSDFGTPERTAGRDAGHRWAAEHFQHEKAALGRLLKLRDAAADAGRDVADRLSEFAAVSSPDPLHEVMRKAPPGSPPGTRRCGGGSSAGRTGTRRCGIRSSPPGSSRGPSGCGRGIWKTAGGDPARGLLHVSGLFPETTDDRDDPDGETPRAGGR
jgi:hypothetical protein